MRHNYNTEQFQAFKEEADAPVTACRVYGSLRAETGHCVSSLGGPEGLGLLPAAGVSGPPGGRGRRASLRWNYPGQVRRVGPRSADSLSGLPLP